ncbi:MAG: hypothetical protein WKG01_12180 [Kofleriaceae bacterium]
MFAIPGIAALIVFILARPQEFFTLLQRVPFLHLFTALAVLGWVIDVRLRRTQPIGTPGLPWAVAFLGWCVVTVAVITPEILLTKTVEMAILFALYFTIAHGIQKFRTLQIVAGVMMATCLFISAVCLHQGYSDKQCVGGQELEGEINGKADGRLCTNNESCYGPDSEPGSSIAASTSARSARTRSRSAFAIAVSCKIPTRSRSRSRRARCRC